MNLAYFGTHFFFSLLARLRPGVGVRGQYELLFRDGGIGSVKKRGALQQSLFLRLTLAEEAVVDTVHAAMRRPSGDGQRWGQAVVTLPLSAVFVRNRRNEKDTTTGTGEAPTPADRITSQKGAAGGSAGQRKTVADGSDGHFDLGSCLQLPRTVQEVDLFLFAGGNGAERSPAPFGALAMARQPAVSDPPLDRRAQPAVWTSPSRSGRATAVPKVDAQRWRGGSYAARRTMIATTPEATPVANSGLSGHDDDPYAVMKWLRAQQTPERHDLRQGSAGKWREARSRLGDHPSARVTNRAAWAESLRM